MSDICRLCMKRGILQNIYLCNSDANLCNKIISCLDIKIEPKDGLPDAICEVCEKNIIEFFDFKERCKDVDLQLRIKNEIEITKTIKNCSTQSEATNADIRNLNKDKYSDTALIEINVLQVQQSNLGKLYICDICKFNSTKREHIKKHMRIHIKLQNNPCLSLFTNNYSHLHTDTEFLFNSEDIDKIIYTTSVEEKQCGFKTEELVNSENKTQFHNTSTNLDIRIPDEIFQKEVVENINFDIETGTGNTKHDIVNEIDHTNIIWTDVKQPRNLQCEYCGKIFKQKSTLQQHLVIHTGEKRYSCKICNKYFTRNAHREVHMRSHLGIKPFVCNICGKDSTKKQDLVRHMRIHSDEKKYSCPVCDRKFKRSGDVHAHMRSHTGVRPYQCKICSKSYRSHGALTKHKIKCQM